MKAHDELLRLLLAVAAEDRRLERSEPGPPGGVALDEDVLAETEAAARRLLAYRRVRNPSSSPPAAGPATDRDDDAHDPWPVAEAAAVPGTFWGEIDDAGRSELLAASATRALSARSFLFRTGDRVDSVFVVMDGWVRITAATPADQEEITVALRGPGELVGEAGALCGSHRGANVQSLGDGVRALEVEAEIFSAYLEASPCAARVIERTAFRRLRDANEQRRIITTASGEERLAAVVCGLAERYGEKRALPAKRHAEGTAGSHRDDGTEGVLVPLPIVVRDLASMCALAPGTVDGITRKWRRCGILGSEGTGIHLRRPPALRELFDDTRHEIRRKATMTREGRAVQAWEDFQRIQAGILEEMERLPPYGAATGPQDRETTDVPGA